MARRDTRTGRDSRCCKTAGAPYRWVDNEDYSHPSVASFWSWWSSLTPFVQTHQEGVLEDLFDRATRGELWESNDGATPIKPIRTDPEVFELRKTLLSTAIRFYHAEPEVDASLLVRHHRHIKNDSSVQQDEINWAVRQHEKWIRNFES